MWSEASPTNETPQAVVTLSVGVGGVVYHIKAAPDTPLVVNALAPWLGHPVPLQLTARSGDTVRLYVFDSRTDIYATNGIPAGWFAKNHPFMRFLEHMYGANAVLGGRENVQSDPDHLRYVMSASTAPARSDP